MTPRAIALVVALVLFAASPFAGEPALVAMSAFVLGAIGFLVIRPDVAPIVPLALGYQWLQVSVATLYASAIGLPLAQLLPLGNAWLATAYGLLALLTATVVAAFAIRRWGAVDLVGLRESLARASLPNLLKVYAVLFVLTVPLDSLFGVGSQIAQLLQGVEAMRWVVLILLIATALIQRTGAPVIAGVLALEVVVGLSGFFASFAIPLMFALLAFVAVFPLLKPRQRAVALALSLLLLALGVFWNAVKNEYRREISGYTGEQIVTVGLGERYSTLGRMASESLSTGMDETFDKFVTRLAYVDYFGIVLDRVPRELPHRDGELLTAAVQHVTMPRLLFPGKAPLPSDSELTAFYTANVYLLYMPGTSISLGYVTEGYIDFGVPGVIAMGVLLALLMSGVAVAFRRAVADPAVAMALTCATLMNLRLFETSLPKLLGGTLSTFIVQLAIVVLLRRWIEPVLHGAIRPGGNGADATEALR